MKPHPRIRKTIKWGGAVVTALLVVVWIGSGWVTISWEHDASYCDLWSGKIWVAWWTPITKPPRYTHRGIWLAARAYDGLAWSFKADLNPPYKSSIEVPLWLPTLVAGLITAGSWHFDVCARRRERVGKCPKCGYDRAGIGAGAVCPECGNKGGPA